MKNCRGFSASVATDLSTNMVVVSPGRHHYRRRFTFIPKAARGVKVNVSRSAKEELEGYALQEINSP